MYAEARLDEAAIGRTHVLSGGACLRWDASLPVHPLLHAQRDPLLVSVYRHERDAEEDLLIGAAALDLAGVREGAEAEAVSAPLLLLGARVGTLHALLALKVTARRTSQRDA